MHCIYKITNKVNGKTYIGQHKYTNLNDSYMGSGKLLRFAQKKYGIENFKKEILVYNVSKEHIDLLEKQFIAFYKSQGKAEYNIAKGGGGGATWQLYDDGTIAKRVSETMKERAKDPKYIKRVSDGVRRYISKHPEYRQKMSETMKEISNRPEQKIKRSIAGYKSAENNRKLVQIPTMKVGIPTYFAKEYNEICQKFIFAARTLTRYKGFMYIYQDDPQFDAKYKAALEILDFGKTHKCINWQRKRRILNKYNIGVISGK